MVTEKLFDDFIFDKMESESDGWQSAYTYKEVIKAMEYAYNLALDHAAENANTTTKSCSDGYECWSFEEVDKESILKLKIVSKK